MSKSIDLETRVDDRGTIKLSRFNREMERSRDAGRRMAATFTHLAGRAGGAMRAITGLRGVVAGLAGVGGIGLLARNAIVASNKQEMAVLGVETAIRAMGRTSDDLSGELQRVASSLQRVSNYGDESILMGAKFLLTYDNITDDLLPRTMKAMIDLAALTGRDMPTAANMLGKASMGMVGALRLAGISVDKTAFKTRGYLGVLEAIERQAGGQAEAMRRATGDFAALGNVLGDIKEKVGKLLKGLLAPTIKRILDWAGDLNDRFGSWLDTLTGKRMTRVKTYLGEFMGKPIYEVTTKTETARGKIVEWGEEILRRAGAAKDELMALAKSAGSAMSDVADAIKPALRFLGNMGERIRKVARALADLVGKFSASKYAKGFQGLGLAAAAPELTFEPKIKMSPAVPWRKGIKNMKEHLAGVASIYKADIDFSSFSEVRKLAFRIRSNKELLNLMASFSAGSRAEGPLGQETARLEKLYQLMMKALERQMGGVTVGDININAPAGMPPEVVRQIGFLLHKEIAAGRVPALG